MKKYFLTILLVLNASQYLLAQPVNQPKPAKHTTFNGIKLYIGQTKENVFNLLSPKCQIDISTFDSLRWDIQLKTEELLTKFGTGEETEHGMWIAFKNNKISHISKRLYLHIGKGDIHDNPELPFETYKELFFILKKYCNNSDKLLNTIKLSSLDKPTGQIRYVDLGLKDRVIRIAIYEGNNSIVISEEVGQ